jgi:hypothetical protein
LLTGELFPGRCKATNLCDYCRQLFIMETVEALWLDAVQREAPTIYFCVGTRTVTTDPKPFYRAREYVMRALKREWPARYASTLEFTTGKGRRSEGLRRPHWNVMLKGCPADELDQVADVVREYWCEHVDAEPQAQFVSTIYQAGGLAQYMVDHFLKESQAPPKGWSGQRFNASRDYFAPLTRAEARQEARRSLRLKRELWKLRREGVPAAVADQLAAVALEVADDQLWELVRVADLPTAFGDDGIPAKYELVEVGPVGDAQ